MVVPKIDISILVFLSYFFRQMVDQSSYLDFVINSLAALIVTCYNVFVYFIHTCFYIFMCMYLRAFLSDWKQSVKECDKLKLDSPLSTERIVIKRKLCDAVIYHMKIIKFVFVRLPCEVIACIMCVSPISV